MCKHSVIAFTASSLMIAKQHPRQMLCCCQFLLILLVHADTVNFRLCGFWCPNRWDCCLRSPRRHSQISNIANNLLPSPKEFGCPAAMPFRARLQGHHKHQLQTLPSSLPAHTHRFCLHTAHCQSLGAQVGQQDTAAGCSSGAAPDPAASTQQQHLWPASCACCTQNGFCTTCSSSPEFGGLRLTDTQ